MTTSGDDENTVIRGVTGPLGGPRLALPDEATDALPPGTRLHEFEIGTVMGRGGFGIVYLARDLSLDRDVAIKEYMPRSLATRTHAMTVAVRSSRQAETFAAGLRSFINEARLLARFDHPSLLKVHRFWEANGTAYMAMPHYQGVTLRTQLAHAGQPPDETDLRALLDPLLDALTLMHAADCFHRDIAPDNILILPDGRPLLLDFGAARRVIAGMTQALTVIVKPGYAPVEQYGDMPNLSQGAWTDLYALASVVEFAITGRTPPQAISRFLSDKRIPLATIGSERYSEKFLRAMDKALAVLPKDRPQSAAALRALLGMEERTPRRIAGMSRPMPLSSGTIALSRPRRRALVETTGLRKGTVVGVTLMAMLLAGAIAAAFLWFGPNRAGSRPSADVTDAPATAAAPAPIEVPSIASMPATAQPDAAPAETAPAPNVEKTPETSAEQPPAASEPLNVPNETLPVEAPPIETPPTSRPVVLPKKARPATPRTTAASELRAAPDIPKKKSSDPRCADIIQRVSLGEVPSAADKALLVGECAR